ncbi:MAG: CinA family protein [Porticoccaceae bacterium]
MRHPSRHHEVAQLAQRLGDQLLQRRAKVATAESCTGGAIAEAITAVPGSSQWFEYGYITYANSAKHRLLGVETGVLERYGAVSEQVVQQMALGAQKAAAADYAVAVSGIAGPDGGTEDKPVGKLWLCWAGKSSVYSERFQLDGDRLSVREQAVEICLKQLLQQLDE